MKAKKVFAVVKYLALVIGLLGLPALTAFAGVWYRRFPAESVYLEGRLVIWAGVVYLLAVAYLLVSPLWRKKFRVAKILLALCLLLLLPAWKAAWDAFAFSKCMRNLTDLKYAFGEYLWQHGGQLPEAANWTDEIYPCLPKNRKDWHIFKCPDDPAPGRSSYAMNANLGGKRVDDLADQKDIVLLYETTKPGANPVGVGAEIPKPPRHLWPGYLATARINWFLFADLGIENSEDIADRKDRRPIFEVGGKPRPALNYRQHIIWTVSKEPPFSTYRVGLGGGDSAGRRFKAEVDSPILQGAFYVSGIVNFFGSVTGPNNMRVSICRDSAGKLGDIAGSELGSVRVPIRVPAEAVYREDSLDIPHKMRGFQVPFLITCNLKKDAYYWLVLTGEGPSSEEDYVILLLDEAKGGSETVVRTVKVDNRGTHDGPPRGMGDWSMPQFLAKLELSEKMPKPSPAK